MEKKERSYVRKAGRTLLVKVLNSNFSLPQLDGLQSEYFTDKSQSYFLVFDDVNNSLNALKMLKKTHESDVRVKFAYYRVFFTMNDLTNEQEYNTVKNQHKELIESNNGSVLYYKLYRKNNEYIGCGDLTLDTKESFDLLMSEDSLKKFNLECGVSGSHFRYRNSSNQNLDNQNSVELNSAV